MVSFNEMQRFYYKSQGILSANVCYCITTDQTPPPFIPLFTLKCKQSYLFATAINDTSGTGGSRRCCWYRWQFATVVVDTRPVALTPVVHLDLQLSPWSFKNIWNDPNVIFRGLWEDDE